MNDEERKRKYNEQREERNARRRAKYREQHPVPQRRERFSSPEEREAARRQRRIERNNVIKGLLNEFRARHSEPTTTTTVQYTFSAFENATVRHAAIKSLVTQHYDEVKEQMDAYRLLKDK